MSELVPIITEVIESNLPADWIEPIKQKIQKVNFVSHDIPAGTPAFLNVEKLLQETLP